MEIEKLEAAVTLLEKIEEVSNSLSNWDKLEVADFAIADVRDFSNGDVFTLSIQHMPENLKNEIINAIKDELRISKNRLQAEFDEM